MNNDYKIYCIIPAYNEEKNIVKVINDVKKYMEHVIVVDDGSRDNTYLLAKKQGVKVLRHIINRGQGAALQTGNEYAISKKADVVVHFDADGQFLANEIKDVLKPILNKDADVVFGSRFLGKKSDIPFTKEKIIMPLGKIINKILLGASLSDPQNGFRAMNYKSLIKIRIENDGMAHCSEIIHKVFNSELKVIEVPTSVIYNDYGQSFGGGVRVLKDLLLYKLLQ